MIVSQHYTNSLVKLFRNTDQTVDILLKDWDRRAVKLEEWQHVYFKLFDGTREIMEKEAELIDFDRGHYNLNLSRAETGALDLGDMTWCMVVKDTELDTVRMLWTNQDYGARSPAKVIEGPLPVQPEAQIIDPTEMTRLSDYFVTSALVGAAQVTNPAGVHSLVLNLDQYTGGMIVEVSIDPDVPAVSEDWIAASTEVFDNRSGVEHFSIVGNYNWVRAKFTSKTGITGISYRNA